MKSDTEARTVPEKKESQWKLPPAGRFLIIAGVSLLVLGLLGFLGIYIYINYTNGFTRNAQTKLASSWEKQPLSLAAVLRGEVNVRAGGAVSRIVIPRIKLDAIVVNLSNLNDRENLKYGPGHIPATAYPGQPGNVVISGHRTTYGAPFGHIDQLRQGDRIVFYTAEGKYDYEVYDSRIVSPDDLTVLDQEGSPRVTLLACHPRFSASKRIAVIGKLLTDR